jgi:hypothetical protein
MLQDLRAPRPTIVEELVAALAPHPKGLRRWSVMRAIRKSREAVSRDIPLKPKSNAPSAGSVATTICVPQARHSSAAPPKRPAKSGHSRPAMPAPAKTRFRNRGMAPRPPNYSQDRLQRERAQAAKAKEKAERRAEETARRKAEQEKPSGDNAS